MTRRSFLHLAVGAPSAARFASAQSKPTIIDIHQHTPYSGRPADDLVKHQRKMGIARTVLLPAGSRYGLAANAGRNPAVWELANRYPDEFVCFANEVPGLPQTKEVLEKYLKQGAVGIGEQKFPVNCDSKEIWRVAEIAKEYDVPVLMHFEHENYNLGFQNFHRTLEKFPSVNFIGHAQTWWGNVDKNHDQTVMYPQTKVTPGGLTDRYLSDYPNMYGDLSAGSGRNSLTRDEDQAREFLIRHQDKLLYGSDCSDAFGEGDRCIGATTQSVLERLISDREILEKIYNKNARKIIKV